MKKLIIYLVPFLLPFVIYGFYILLARAGVVRRPLTTPWVMLFGAGLLLMVVGVGVLALTGGAEPDAAYTPPRVENGEIRSGTFQDD